MEENKKKRSLFFRNYFKDGKGVKKEEAITDFTFANFFKLYFRRFGRLVYINFLYIFGNFPFLFFILAISGNFSLTAPDPVSEFYPIAAGLWNAAPGNPAAGLAMSLFGGMKTAFSHSTPACIVLFSISALFLVTFGPVNAGCAYLIRNQIKGEPTFLFEDFFHAVKSNFLPSLFVGILDLAVLGAGVYALNFYRNNYSTYYILFFCAIAAFCIYFFMRFYVYTILVTFKVSFRQLIKNSFILSILALGKNFLALFGILFFALLTFSLAVVFMPLGIIILMMFFFSTVSFISAYVAYPKIKKYMIDPYYKDGESEEDGEDEPEAPLFRDRG